MGLSHDLTVGYEALENVLLETINGAIVRNLRHVAELIEACTSGYLRLGLQNNLTLVLKAEATGKATAEVLEQHGIPAALSPDLADLAGGLVEVTTNCVAASITADGGEDEDLS